MSKTIEVVEVPEFEARVQRAYTSDSDVTYLTLMGEDGAFSVSFAPGTMEGIRVSDGDTVQIRIVLSEARGYTRIRGASIRLANKGPKVPA